MGLIRAFKKWRAKRRIYKVLLKVIKSFYRRDIDHDRLAEVMGFRRIANNGYDDGGFVLWGR